MPTVHARAWLERELERVGRRARRRLPQIDARDRREPIGRRRADGVLGGPAIDEATPGTTITCG